MNEGMFPGTNFLLRGGFGVKTRWLRELGRSSQKAEFEASHLVVADFIRKLFWWGDVSRVVAWRVEALLLAEVKIKPSNQSTNWREADWRTTCEKSLLCRAAR